MTETPDRENIVQQCGNRRSCFNTAYKKHFAVILLFKKLALFRTSPLGKRKDGPAQYPVEQMCDMHPDVCKLADQMREYFSSTAGATRCLAPTAPGVAPWMFVLSGKVLSQDELNVHHLSPCLKGLKGPH